jgi:TonB family protein
MKFLLSYIFLLLIFVSGTTAQVINAPKSEDNWIRIESPSRDLSIAAPSNYIVYNDAGLYRMYFYVDGVQMQISMEEKKNAKKEFKQGLAFIKDKKKYDFFSGGDFVGMQYTGKDELSEDFNMSLTLASSKGSYRISVYTKNLPSKVYSKFLRSLRLNGQNFFAQNSEYADEQQNILISALKTDEIVLKALQQPDSKQSEFEKTTREDKETKIDTTNYSRGLIILHKPRASYTDSARERQIQGTVKLKATFLATGQVGAIKLIKYIDRDLDKEAFKAIRKIKFLPAEVDGKPVDSERFIEYSFTIY